MVCAHVIIQIKNGLWEGLVFCRVAAQDFSVANAVTKRESGWGAVLNVAVGIPFRKRLRNQKVLFCPLRSHPGR